MKFNQTKLSLHSVGAISAVVCAYTLALCFPCRITVLLCLAASLYMAYMVGIICTAYHDDNED